MVFDFLQVYFCLVELHEYNRSQNIFREKFILPNSLKTFLSAVSFTSTNSDPTTLTTECYAVVFCWTN